MSKNLVDIPTFHGDIEQWEAFYQVFKIMVEEDDSIPNVMKHNILRNHVSGVAENRRMPTTDGEGSQTSTNATKPRNADSNNINAKCQLGVTTRLTQMMSM
ncbi:hypothetical protein CRE_25868 [Caenorhabditis remanei]|uniref:Uncharacterized protein n=1 Tax=Caenorhabditis remanei TaxID=31234 RepID=E3NDQ5_CAERE|nr:hypothetical protein CRE_25868 [Caenorhabditis remanei]